jgi:hypothetical protein
MAMSSKTILSGVDFIPSSDIKYSKPKVDARGGKSIGILNAACNTATYISTPLMLTWGINEFVDDKTGRVSYDMALQFPNEEYAKADTTKFLKNMIILENKIKKDAIINAKEWFGKPKMSEDAIDALWTPMLKYPKDKNTLEPDTTRAPTLKIKIPYWEGEWKTELYNIDQQVIFPDPDGSSVTPKDLIAKGSHIAVVLQCGGIWFANGKFGVTWKLLQGVVKPRETIKGKCHILLSNEDKALMQLQKINDDDEEDNIEVDNSVNTTHVADSDNEEEIKQELSTTVRDEVNQELSTSVTDEVKQEVSEIVKEVPKKKKIIKKVVKKT